MCERLLHLQDDERDVRRRRRMLQYGLLQRQMLRGSGWNLRSRRRLLSRVVLGRNLRLQARRRSMHQRPAMLRRSALPGRPVRVPREWQRMQSTRRVLHELVSRRRVLRCELPDQRGLLLE